MFAERLQAAMEYRELTQGQLEVRTGISQSYISRVLRGKNVPTIDVAARLADALDVSLDWLAERERRSVEEYTPDEEALVNNYRRVPNELKPLMINVVRNFVAKER